MEQYDYQYTSNFNIMQSIDMYFHFGVKKNAETFYHTK